PTTRPCPPSPPDALPIYGRRQPHRRGADSRQPSAAAGEARGAAGPAGEGGGGVGQEHAAHVREPDGYAVRQRAAEVARDRSARADRKSTRLNSSHVKISY